MSDAAHSEKPSLSVRTAPRLMLPALLSLATSIAPQAAWGQAGERSGREVVESVCATCHEAGTGGAPKIGDQDAWRLRLGQGLEHLVRSAIHGHGGMPPRGGKADLTDAEIRSAIIYMFNPREAAAAKEAAAAQPAKPAGNVRSVAGMEIYLGFMPAEVLRSYPQGSVERTMHGGVPRGSGYYHVNVSVIDAASNTPVAGAKVDVRIERPGLGGETKTLRPVRIGNVPSYGRYVRLSGNTSYVVTVRVRKPHARRTVEARFDHKLF